MIHRLEQTVPWLLALFVVVTSMRGLAPGSTIWWDSPHHALNGALVYDMVRTGNFAHPIAYAEHYRSRFPAISIPYHPPLFPVIESLFYATFGVNYSTARLVVALAAGGCASQTAAYRASLGAFGGSPLKHAPARHMLGPAVSPAASPPEPRIECAQSSADKRLLCKHLIGPMS